MDLSFAHIHMFAEKPIVQRLMLSSIGEVN